MNFNNKKTTFKDFLGAWEPTFVAFGGLFFEFLTHNFFNYIPFLTIFII